MTKPRKTREEYLSSALSRLKPWEQEGVSRATWYRLRREGETGPAVETSVSAPLEPDETSPRNKSLATNETGAPNARETSREPDPIREWWNEPLKDWQEGRLEMRNIVTGKTTIINFDGEIAKRRKRPQEREPAARHWTDEVDR